MYQLWQIHAMIVRIRLRKVNLTISPQISCPDKFLTNTCNTTFTNTCNNFANAIIVTNTCKKSEPFHLASNFQPWSILGDPIHLKPKVVKKFGQLSQSFWSFQNHHIFSEVVDIIPFFSSHPKLSHIFSSRVKIISQENKASPIIADYRQTWWPPRNGRVGSRSCSKLWLPPLRPGRQKYIITFLLPHYFVSHIYGEYIDEVLNLGRGSTIVKIKK